MQKEILWRFARNHNFYGKLDAKAVLFFKRTREDSEQKQIEWQIVR